MGEYYAWVNEDREEYITPSDFDCGSKVHESCQRDGCVLGALRDLLANEWNGDRVIFLGDECGVPENVEEDVLRELYRQSTEDYTGVLHLWSIVCENYRNVSGLYRESEEIVSEEIGFFLEDLQGEKTECRNEYGVDPEKPFEGLFQRGGRQSGYVVNYTKNVAYSITETEILHSDGQVSDFADPLPDLMGYGRVLDPGDWLGDRIGVLDELDEDFEFLKQITLEW